MELLMTPSIIKIVPPYLLERSFVIAADIFEATFRFVFADLATMLSQ